MYVLPLARKVTKLAYLSSKKYLLKFKKYQALNLHNSEEKPHTIQRTNMGAQKYRHDTLTSMFIPTKCTVAFIFLEAWYGQNTKQQLQILPE
jgi:hypothetical protein